MKNSRILLTLFTLLSLGTFAASCHDGSSSYPLRPPTSQAQQQAESWLSDHPGGRVYFSQLSGRILALQATPGTSLDSNGLLPALTAEEALASVRRLLSQSESPFEISSPNTEIRLSILGRAFTEAPLERGGGISVRVEQVLESGRVDDSMGLALFDGSGRMTFFMGRFVPSAGTENIRSSGLRLSEKTRMMRTRPLPRNQSWFWDFRNPAAPELRTYEVIRNGIETRRVIRDENGNEIETRIETPTAIVTPPNDWSERATAHSSTAIDNQERVISLPTLQITDLPSPLLVMALQAPLQGWVVDNGRNANRFWVGNTPIASNSSSWQLDSTYVSELRDATGLLVNIEKTLRFSREELGLNSYDDRGSAFRGAIRGRGVGHADTPDLNAYGGGGAILVGDARTPNGLSLGDSLDVVAHEFFHSVIIEGPDFFYDRESGALTEGLCDFYGKTVEGFTSSRVGQDVDVPFRDLMTPSSLGHPEAYSEFKALPLDQDHGGVHHNSTIISHALYRWADEGAEPLETRAIQVTKFILEALKDLAWAPDSKLEEFAVGLSAYCGTDVNCTTLLSVFEESELVLYRE